MKKIISYLVFYILQFSYGIIMNVIGLLVAIFMLLTFHKPHKFGPSVVFITKIMNGSGISFGMFFLVGEEYDDYVIHHESGHGIQNIIFGPLFLFLVGIPSIIRYWYREFKYYRKGLDPKTEYDDIWFEGQATKLGKKIYKIK